jgi:transcriptional regulator with PAS, ATPase and Fis domain
MRLGSSTAIPLRARILFATNRNLRQMVEAGTFREDLYYRLNVLGIHAHPLRERRDDIPLLAEHFLNHYARTYGRSILGISHDALGLLCRYDWPGNVRELENVIQRAIVLCDKDTIVPSDLPDHVREAGADEPEEAASNSFEDRVHGFRIRLVMDALSECHGNKTLAAQRLSISRTYLHRLIRPESDVVELVA